MLRQNELPESLTIALMRGESRSERSFSVPPNSAVDVYDLQTPMWFKHADLNGDGDLSRREFLGNVTQFAALDQDEDGFIELDEIKNN